MVCNLEVYKEPWSPVLSNTTVPRDWGKEHCPVIVSKPRMTSQSPSKTPGQKSCRGRSCQTALKGPEHQGRKLRRARQAETTQCTSELRNGMGPGGRRLGEMSRHLLRTRTMAFRSLILYYFSANCFFAGNMRIFCKWGKGVFISLLQITW